MKVAIQGHPTRGKEVIQILESLGGVNDGLHKGDNPDCYYELHDNIIWCVYTKGINFKYYTLEEFEKEFPFKIGDRVVSFTTGLIGTIIKFSENGIYHIKYDNGICSFTSEKYLKPYKEMQKRNITLTLDKAKEWYKKGGELKEVALQAYSEEELNLLPRSWEEFCENYPVKNGECWLNGRNTIEKSTVSCERKYKNWIPSQKSAEAHLAMIQLEQLRNCWRQGWKPDWNNGRECKYCIVYSQGKFKISTLFEIRRFLSFPTMKLAEEFLECFRDLIEKIDDLA